MTIPSITLDSQITLRDLSTQIEDGVALIGWQGQFLELPPEGIEFIGWLNEGLTVGQARERFETKFNPFPDEDLFGVMDAFLDSDFIAVIDGHDLTPQKEEPIQDDGAWIPQVWAQRIYSTPVLLAWIAFVLPATWLWVTTPSLWPRYSDYFWIEYNFIIILVGLLVWLFAMFAHELSHLLAARAKGIEATITWTQRLGFIPMSQTIMHNIWAVPRNSRYLPLVAGMMTDWVQMGVLLYLLSAYTVGLLSLPLLFVKFMKFYLLVLLMGVTAQFWLFSKMDGYFLLSALLGQRNLQADTYSWLGNQFKKLPVLRNLPLIRSLAPFEPPPAGMRYIYIYSLITLSWGALFMGQFLLVQIPIKIRLIWESLLKIGAGVALNPIEFADGIATLLSQGIDVGLLIYAYLRTEK
ncbi:hypothetical protein QUF63_08945 [Anaerolineales bacterium HSG25]|nr:hypothetical protein [Anaerolineales bacterium HSG25]